jgi:hypothetical protein
MDPDDIQLLSFLNAQGIDDDDDETSISNQDQQADCLSLHERYRTWLDSIDR